MADNKSLAIIMRRLSRREVASLVDKENPKFILSSYFDLPDFFAEQKNCLLLKYFSKEEYNKYIYKFNKLIDNFHPVGSKPPLLIGNLSLWDYFKKHIAFELIDDFILYHLYEKIIILEKPYEIIFFTNNNAAQILMITSLSKKYGVDLTICKQCFRPIHWFISCSYYLLINRECIFRVNPFLIYLADTIQIMLWKIKIFRNRHHREAREKASGKQVILFLCGSQKYLVRLLNHVYSTVIKRKNIDLKIIKIDDASIGYIKYLKQNNLDFLSCHDYLESIDRYKIIRLSRAIKKEKHYISQSDLSVYFRLNVGYAFSHAVRSAFCINFAYGQLKRFARAKIAIEKILEKFPDALVLLQDDRNMFGRLIAGECYKQRMRCLSVISPVYKYNTYWPIFFDGYTTVSHYAVTDEYSKSALIDYGINREKISVIGNANIMASRNSSDAGEFLRLLKAQNKKIILFASQQLPLNDYLHYLLIKTMNNFPGVNLVIKLHPEEFFLRSRFMVKKAKFNNVFIIQTANMNKLIKIADIVLSVSSTAIINAIKEGKPVGILDFGSYVNKIRSAENYFLEYSDSDYVKIIKSPRELTREISKLLATVGQGFLTTGECLKARINSTPEDLLSYFSELLSRFIE